jgi:hypothetical protein
MEIFGALLPETPVKDLRLRDTLDETEALEADELLFRLLFCINLPISSSSASSRRRFSVIRSGGPVAESAESLPELVLLASSPSFSFSGVPSACSSASSSEA